MKRPPPDHSGQVPVHVAPGAVVPYGWRFGRHLTRGRADVLLRSQVLRRLKGGWRGRFSAMGLPDDVVSATLAQVRTLSGWAEAWTGTAQQFLGDARRAEREGDIPGDAALRQRAALCYHIAGWFAYEDERLAKACRASATSLFARTVTQTLPRTRRVLVPWRTTMLPGYLAIPSTPDPSPLVVLLNGVTTSKEELILWRTAFLREGLAVLALDNPGTGEVSDGHVPDPRDDDFTAGVFDLATHDRDLDPDRVVLVGFSLGGAIAVHAAAAHHRIAGVVAVTPPYAPGDWFDRAIPLLREQCLTTGSDQDMGDLAEAYDLGPTMTRLRCPVLVFGAGQDLLVPPAEAVRLAAAGGDLATLVWYPRGTHGLYDALDDWTTDAARWVTALLGHDAATAPIDRPNPDIALSGSGSPVPPPKPVDSAGFPSDRSPGHVVTPPGAGSPVERPVHSSRVTGPMHGSPAAGAAPPPDPGPVVVTTAGTLPIDDLAERGGEGNIPQVLVDSGGEHDTPQGPGPEGAGPAQAGRDARAARDARDSHDRREADAGSGRIAGDPGTMPPVTNRWSVGSSLDGEDRIIDSRVMSDRPSSTPTDSTAEHPIARPEDYP